MRLLLPRLAGPGLVLTLLVGLLAATPGSGAASATAPDALSAAPVEGFRACARPALAPSLRLGTPERVTLDVGDEERIRKQARAAYRVARRGGEMRMPARAQALAVTAALAGELTGRPDGFYRGLTEVEGWRQLPPTIAVHRVLRTPDPFAYEGWWDRTVRLLDKLKTGKQGIDTLLSPGGGAPPHCYASASDRKALPLPPGYGYRVRPARGAGKRAAGSGDGAKAEQKPGETGFDAACGTPVLAATPGTVELVRNNPAAGPWTIKVHQKETGVTTRYTHVQQVRVEDGATVLVGQPLAEVGDLGAVDRCTLGLSLTRKRKGRTQVLDPTRWLAPKEPGPIKVPATSFKVGTYNVLGERLTAPGGGRPGWGSGTARVARGMARVSAHGISILVLNELENGQAGVVQGRGWTLHRATANNRNGHGSAIAWRPGEWKAIDTGQVSTPIRRRLLHHPTVLLEHVDTGARVHVLGLHNPVGHNRSKAAARASSLRIQLGWINQVRDTAPVVVGGDFNDREPARAWAARSGLSSPAPGGRHPVDWIFGTPDLEFQGETVERFESARISDHPLVLASVVIPAHEVPRTDDE